jgi:hypothetical protein
MLGVRSARGSRFSLSPVTSVVDEEAESNNTVP